MEIIVDKSNNQWLTKNQIAQIYSKDLSSIRRQIDNFFKRQNVDYLGPLLAKFATEASDGRTINSNHYSIEILYALDTNFSVNIGHQLKEYIDCQLSNEILANDGEVIIYNDNLEIEVTFSLEEDTVWMNQNQIADSYIVTQPNISKHLQNIYEH